VLKPGGYLYLNWQPSWSSARGHHVHPGQALPEGLQNTNADRVARCSPNSPVRDAHEHAHRCVALPCLQASRRGADMWQAHPANHLSHAAAGMVEEWAAANGCTEKPAYANDGSVIADWSHLLLSRGEFRAALEATPLGACAGLPETVMQYVYEHSDLNRVPYEDVVTGVKLLRDVEILQVCSLPWRPPIESWEPWIRC